jgi:hypothetical protein
MTAYCATDGYYHYNPALMCNHTCPTAPSGTAHVDYTARGAATGCSATTFPLASGGSCLTACALHYLPATLLNITCNSGVLSADPTCTVDPNVCFTAPSGGAHVDYSAGGSTSGCSYAGLFPLASGQTCLTACAAGYSAPAPTLAITCTNGTLSAPPTCTPPGPVCLGSVLSVLFSAHAAIGSCPTGASDITSGSSCMEACTAGYTAIVYPTQTCSAGVWTGAQPVCLAQCSSPVPPAGAGIGSCAGLTDGNSGTCALTAASGFSVVAADLTITCNDGSWSTLPVLRPQALVTAAAAPPLFPGGPSVVLTVRFLASFTNPAGQSLAATGGAGLVVQPAQVPLPLNTTAGSAVSYQMSLAAAYSGGTSVTVTVAESASKIDTGLPLTLPVVPIPMLQLQLAASVSGTVAAGESSALLLRAQVASVFGSLSVLVNCSNGTVSPQSFLVSYTSATASPVLTAPPVDVATNVRCSAWFASAPYPSLLGLASPVLVVPVAPLCVQGNAQNVSIATLLQESVSVTLRLIEAPAVVQTAALLTALAQALVIPISRLSCNSDAVRADPQNTAAAFFTFTIAPPDLADASASGSDISPPAWLATCLRPSALNLIGAPASVVASTLTAELLDGGSPVRTNGALQAIDITSMPLVVVLTSSRAPSAAAQCSIVNWIALLCVLLVAMAMIGLAYVRLKFPQLHEQLPPDDAQPAVLISAMLPLVAVVAQVGFIVAVARAAGSGTLESCCCAAGCVLIVVGLVHNVAVMHRSLRTRSTASAAGPTAESEDASVLTKDAGGSAVSAALSLWWSKHALFTRWVLAVGVLNLHALSIFSSRMLWADQYDIPWPADEKRESSSAFARLVRRGGMRTWLLRDVPFVVLVCIYLALSSLSCLLPLVCVLLAACLLSTVWQLVHLCQQTSLERGQPFKRRRTAYIMRQTVLMSGPGDGADSAEGIDALDGSGFGGVAAQGSACGPSPADCAIVVVAADCDGESDEPPLPGVPDTLDEEEETGRHHTSDTAVAAPTAQSEASPELGAPTRKIFNSDSAASPAARAHVWQQYIVEDESRPLVVGFAASPQVAVGSFVDRKRNHVWQLMRVIDLTSAELTVEPVEATSLGHTEVILRSDDACVQPAHSRHRWVGALSESQPAVDVSISQLPDAPIIVESGPLDLSLPETPVKLFANYGAQLRTGHFADVALRGRSHAWSLCEVMEETAEALHVREVVPCTDAGPLPAADTSVVSEWIHRANQHVQPARSATCGPAVAPELAPVPLGPPLSATLAAAILRPHQWIVAASDETEAVIHATFSSAAATSRTPSPGLTPPATVEATCSALSEQTERTFKPPSPTPPPVAAFLSVPADLSSANKPPLSSLPDEFTIASTPLPSNQLPLSPSHLRRPYLHPTSTVQRTDVLDIAVAAPKTGPLPVLGTRARVQAAIDAAKAKRDLPKQVFAFGSSQVKKSARVRAEPH